MQVAHQTMHRFIYWPRMVVPHKWTNILRVTRANWRAKASDFGNMRHQLWMYVWGPFTAGVKNMTLIAIGEEIVQIMWDVRVLSNNEGVCFFTNGYLVRKLHGSAYFWFPRLEFWVNIIELTPKIIVLIQCEIIIIIAVLGWQTTNAQLAIIYFLQSTGYDRPIRNCAQWPLLLRMLTHE